MSMTTKAVSLALSRASELTREQQKELAKEIYNAAHYQNDLTIDATIMEHMINKIKEG